LPELAGWLAARRGRTIVALGCPIPGIAGDVPKTLDARAALLHARRPKDAVEIERMRRAAAATAAGFEAAQRMIRPGVTERIQVTRGGVPAPRRRRDGYHTIVMPDRTRRPPFHAQCTGRPGGAAC
jgi:Xaa-Pro aminopeptidase